MATTSREGSMCRCAEICSPDRRAAAPFVRPNRSMAAGTKMVHKMQASSSTATARPGPHHADCLLTGEDEGGGDAGHDRGRGDDDPAAWSPPGGVPAGGPFRAAQETRNTS